MSEVKPRIRLDKKEIKKGEAIEIKSLVSHTMESGQRKAADGKVIPRKILNRFTLTLGDKTLIDATIEPAISANPYLQFKIKPQESGDLIFTWHDDDGSKITAKETIKVS